MIAREIASRIGREEVRGKTASSRSPTTVTRTTVAVVSVAVIHRLSTVLRREIGKRVSHGAKTSIAAPPSFPLPLSFFAVDPLLHVTQISRETLAGVFKDRQTQPELDLGHLLHEIYEAEAL